MHYKIIKSYWFDKYFVKLLSPLKFNVTLWGLPNYFFNEIDAEKKFDFSFLDLNYLIVKPISLWQCLKKQKQWIAYPATSRGKMLAPDTVLLQKNNFHLFEEVMLFLGYSEVNQINFNHKKNSSPYRG